jgi:fructose-1-phosphate kinase PfkB-like protein
VPLTGPYPTGSDEAFLAGLAVVLAGGGSLDAALRSALAASIANSLQPGAGRLDRGRVDALAASLEVREVH